MQQSVLVLPLFVPMVAYISDRRISWKTASYLLLFSTRNLRVQKIDLKIWEKGTDSPHTKDDYLSNSGYHWQRERKKRLNAYLHASSIVLTQQTDGMKGDGREKSRDKVNKNITREKSVSKFFVRSNESTKFSDNMSMSFWHIRGHRWWRYWKYRREINNFLTLSHWWEKKILHHQRRECAMNSI